MPTPIRREQLSVDVPAGASWNPCRLATTANHGLSGLADIDGQTPVTDDRILVKEQSTGAQNGIYVAAVGAWSRADDFDESTDVDPGALVNIAEGTDSGATAWQMTTPGPITLGTTALTFEIIGRGGSDPGSHASEHLPSGSQPLTTAVAVGLDGNSTNSEGGAESFARSNHTHEIDDSTGTNSTVNAGDAASDGTAAGFSKKDHQHAVATGASISTIEPDDTAAEGDSSNLARENHVHAIVAAAPTQGIGADNTEGAATSFARSNHDHTIRESGGQDLTMSTVADGQLVERAGTTLAGITAIDDTQHGSRSGGTLHSAATTSVNGFLSAADKLKLDALIDPRYRTPKDSLRALATADVTLNGNQTVDGVSMANGDRVGCFNQATTSQDGIYVVNTGGAWARAIDFQSGDGAAGAFFPSEEGTANADKTWLVTNDDGSDVIGTDDLALVQIGAGSPRGAGAGMVLNGNDLDVVANADASIVVNANDVQVGVLASDAQHGVRGGGTQHADVVAAGADGFMTGSDKTKLDDIDTGATATTPQQERVTTETITGSDTALTDTLDNTPYSDASVSLFFNGVHMIQGVGEDYTISGSTITWLASTGTAPNMKTTDDLVAVYMS